MVIFMFDGIFLSKLQKELSIIKSGRISKIIESADNEFIFQIRVNKMNLNLLLSYSQTYSRIHFTNKVVESINQVKSYTMFLRKHIGGYFIEDIYQYETDRILIMKLSGFNEMQDKNTKYLISEIMGRYSNMILTDENYVILDALKHDGIGEYNRTILPNAIYEFPKTEKLNPYNYNKIEMNQLFIDKKIDNPKDITNTFNGISLMLSYSVFKNDYIANNFYDYINTDIKPSIIKGYNDQLDFYYNNLNYEIIKQFNTLSELLDEYYYDLDLKAKIKAKTGDISSFLNKQINKLSDKIIKLNNELLDSEKKDTYKLYGELLLSYPKLKDKLDIVNIYNYYDNTYINIKLDKKYDIIENSNRYYKKYQKAKKATSFIKEQIDICNNEIEYFNLLLSQLKFATLNEALDIQDELIKNKYLFKQLNNTKKKKEKPKLLTYIVNDTFISVGKNNIQNDYLTNQFSKASDMWFHVKDAPGSHVVIHSDTLDETLIRTAANLAAYYSTKSDSSSVAVDYTLIKNIKKIPGKKSCFVTYKNQKTIYIDPNIDLINKLEVKMK